MKCNKIMIARPNSMGEAMLGRNSWVVVAISKIPVWSEKKAHL